ncbi:MAG TPA: serine acetyltransferase, partial [Planctomycetia bacterium]|nr:serine acetyltransferase [Planctomycetia bacterium]
MHPESIQSTPLRGILSDLLGAYGDCPDVHHLDQCPLPNRDAITRLLGDLREILFPGFGARQNLRSETLEYYVADVLLRLHEQLTEQIGRALRHSRPEAGCNWDDYRRTGQDLAEAFLAKLPDVMHLLQADIQAAYDGDPAAESKVETVFCYPGIEAVTIY